MINILNWIMIVLAIITAFLSWRIYRITLAKSLLYIFFAMCLGVVVRILIAVWSNFTYATYPSFAFWVLWTVGLYLLLKLLTKYMKTNGKHDEEELRNKDKIK